MFIEFGLIDSCYERNDKAAFLHHTVGTRECVFPNRVQYHIHILGHFLELCFCIIDRYICAKLLEEILIGSRRGRDNFRPSRLGDLDRKCSYPARSTMNQHSLASAKLRGIDQCLPCRQSDNRHAGGFDKTDRFRFGRGLDFARDRVLRISAALCQAEVRINGVARFELRDLPTCFLDDSSDVVTRNKRQRYSEKLRGPFGAGRLIHRIYAGSDHANEYLIFLRFWPGHILVLQNLGAAIFMNDNSFHHWLGTLDKRRERDYESTVNNAR